MAALSEIWLMRPRLNREERIRTLCAEAVESTDWDELQPILSDLRNALHQQADHVKRMVADERARQIMGFGNSDSRRKAHRTRALQQLNLVLPASFE
jgi:hypothetical protein